VREYFAEIGKRGGQAGRRELTRQQAKLLVAIREAKRAAKKRRQTASDDRSQAARVAPKARNKETLSPAHRPIPAPTRT
jgi:molybdenum-dependent DNA-binding transcriptional regulator ModE